MSVLDRVELIRESENINKSEFEKILGKSSGYISILQKKGSLPGSDVLIKISENFTKYNLEWLLTGRGEMLREERGVLPTDLAHEPDAAYEKAELSHVVLGARDAIFERLEVISESLYMLHKEHDAIMRHLKIEVEHKEEAE